MLIRDVIAQRIADAVEAAQRSGAIPTADVPGVALDRPQDPDHGDFASSLPLRLAKQARMAPLAIAEALVEHVAGGDPVGRVWAAPPGFVNVALSPAWLQRQVDDVLAQGAAFGDTQTGGGRSVQVEFVSVNPTGPVHVGHARGAVLGSTLANTLAAAGFDVTREYYVNDAGTQMELFYA